MTLTDQQVANWRKVLITMGMMPFVVDNLPKEQIEIIAINFQRRLSLEAEMERRLKKPSKPEKPSFKSKFNYKRF
jgi:hypothetical protein